MCRAFLISLTIAKLYQDLLTRRENINTPKLIMDMKYLGNLGKSLPT